jgi:hypothetical protein
MIEMGDKPDDAVFSVRVDWSMHAFYWDKVFVELDRNNGDYASTLARFDTVLDAIAYAKHYLAFRGYGFTCNVEAHQERNDTHITLHAKKERRPQVIAPDIFYDEDYEEELPYDEDMRMRLALPAPPAPQDALRLITSLENSDAD